MANKMIIKKSKIHKKGIFSNQDIKIGKVVFTVKGKLVHHVVKDKKTSLCGSVWIGMSKHSWVNPDEPARFLNHSCNPNCGIKGKLRIIALKNIKKGEEVTIDYSITEMDKLWYMKCNCGSKNCRKIIRSIQFLPKKVYNKYAPYVPTYFMKVYKAYNYDKKG